MPGESPASSSKVILGHLGFKRGQSPSSASSSPVQSPSSSSYRRDAAFAAMYYAATGDDGKAKALGDVAKVPMTEQENLMSLYRETAPLTDDDFSGPVFS